MPQLWSSIKEQTACGAVQAYLHCWRLSHQGANNLCISCNQIWVPNLQQMKQTLQPSLGELREFDAWSKVATARAACSSLPAPQKHSVSCSHAQM